MSEEFICLRKEFEGVAGDGIRLLEGLAAGRIRGLSLADSA